MEKINLDKIFSSQTVLMDTQKAVPTTGRTNFCRVDRQMSLNSKWWKKETFQKKSFKKPSWLHGKQLWQFCRLFFDEKKTGDFLFKFGRAWKKHKQKFCQNKVMSSNWSLELVECSFVKLTGKVSKTFDKFLLNVQKLWEKNVFDRSFLLPQLVAKDRHKAVLATPHRIFCRNARKKIAQVSIERKKRTFSKKKLFKGSPWEIVSRFGKPVNWFPTKKKIFYRSMFETDEKRLKKFVKTIVFLQIDLSDS